MRFIQETIKIGAIGALFIGSLFVIAHNKVFAWTEADQPIYQFTVAGNTANGQLNNPYAVIKDNAGNIYVTDTYNHHIDKYDSSGTWLTKYGSYGTGNGQFNRPEGIAIDSSGNFYVTDYGNNRVEKFDSSWNYLSTIGSAGSGNGQFANPRGIYIASNGKIYVTDYNNNRIDVFNADGSYANSFGSYGTGNGQFRNPSFIYISPDNEVYVTDYANSRIEVFDLAGNYLRKWGSQGAGDGQFLFTNGIYGSSDGKIFVVDYMVARIQVFTTTGVFLYEFGSSGEDNGSFLYPAGIYIDNSSNVYVADMGNSRVQKFTLAGVFQSKISDGLTAGSLTQPYQMTTDASGNIYVADTYGGRVNKYDAAGNFLLQFGSYGTGTDQVGFPYDVAIGSDGKVYVTDATNCRIQVYNADGSHATSFGTCGTGAGQFHNPMGIGIDSSGNIFVLDYQNNTVQKFNSSYAFVTQWGSYGTGNGQFRGARGLAIDSSNNIYIGDGGNYRVQKFSNSGTYITQFGGHGSGAGQFVGTPGQVDIGPNDYVYVADRGGTIVKFDSTGNYISRIGTLGYGPGQITSLNGVGVHGTSVFAVDLTAGRVLVYTYDRIAPSVTLTHLTNDFSTNTSITFTGTAIDALSNITAIQYQIDGTSGTWLPITPSDGSLDSPSESFSLPLTLSEGAHTIYIRATDSYTNTSTPLSYSFLIDEPPIGTISINNGDFGTTSPDVTLTLTASDPGSGIAGMMLSENSSFTGASWEAFSPSVSWTLSSGEAHKTIYYKLKDNAGLESTFSDSVWYDNTPPVSNASSIVMKRSPTGVTVPENGWVSPSPYFSWTAGSDGANGSGIKGYCLYIGSDSSADPEYTKGLLGTSPVSTSGTPCQFIIATNSIDLSNPSYHGSSWLTTSSSPYYINLKAIDNMGFVYPGGYIEFAFKYDAISPKNVNYIVTPGSTFSNISDMFFSWPISGSVASNDTDGNNSGVYGWQYQLNDTSGTWHGSLHSDLLGVDYIPLTDSSYTLTQAQDGGSIVSGNNTVYFRTLDLAGNASSDATIRTGVLKLGGLAPHFGGSDSVTVTPSSNTTNSYALSWPAATPDTGRSITHYYYSVNTLPPTTLDTLQSNRATYIDNGTSRTVSATVLPGANRGTNHVYVIAIDDGSPTNYSPSNYISGSFTLDSTNPDNVGSLVASDSSIKATQTWNVTLTWTEPVYKGAGNLSYHIYRSSDGDTFTEVGTTSGLSYVDNTPSSRLYYYKVVTKDGANAESSGTNTVSIAPTGRWTTAPDLVTGPTVSGITARKATISWTTSRSADTKVQYGTKHNTYGSVEPSLSDQVSAHSIQVSGLMPNTTYYYKVKWTDEDGNTGVSSEHTFKTASPPIIKNLGISNINVSTATVKFSSTGASSVKVYYGPTTSFGGVTTQAVSGSSGTYSVPLTKLSDGTKYYYRLSAVDSDGYEYGGTIYDFTTPPKPTITNIDIQELADTALTTVQVNWDSNTAVTSVLAIHPVGSKNIRTESETKRISGTHTYKISNLRPQTQYSLRITGTDAKGNQTVSDEYIFTTSTDSRPPDISNLSIETVILPDTSGVTKQAVAQIIVSWNTDELSTSQVAFGEGSGTTYGQSTPEDANLTYNHSVVISDLQPAKVYHLQVLSKDAAGNEARSVDTTAITPKATEDALSLVIESLSESFKFLRK